MEFDRIGTQQIIIFVVGILIFTLVPLAVAIVWKVKKKEKFTTILVGAGVFFLFAYILEKLLQAVVIMPTALGLPEHNVSIFLNSHPILWSLVVGLFPGVFEETGRFVAFKTILRNRKNRETAISYGIGHGGFEVMIIVGLAYIQNVMYSVMINTGLFQIVIDQVAAQTPDQVGAIAALPAQLASVTIGTFLLAIVERIFAVVFHIGCSIMVFYACKDEKKFWLYPLTIVLHTLLDMIVGGLVLTNVISMPIWLIEVVMAVVGLATFAGAYFGLYRKDKA